MGKSPRTVAILGGGPAGASLGARLARRGLDVVLFSSGQRPELVVGESLVPAIVPHLRDLGIEDEVASYGIYKGGATFLFDTRGRLSFRFEEVIGARTNYAYNVPRDRFDASVLGAARRAGVSVVEATGRLERDGEDSVRLSADTLAAAGPALRRQPDLVVDAGGRRRTLPRLLGIPCIDGDRRDTALHAHFEGVEVEIPGNVHTDRLEHGWAWRIPLRGRVSLGIVVNSEVLRKFGDTPEEQLDNFLRQDTAIRDFARPARRVTPVIKYTNYQSRATRGIGANWALVGDTFGFVDPVFSSGLLIAFQSSAALARAIATGTPRAMARYERATLRNLMVWQQIARRFYDGSLLTMFRVGQVVRHTRLGWLLDTHFRRHMPRIFTGENATNRYSRGLVEFMCAYGLAGNDPREFEIH
jgi:flavin-dependent dehydrogenase